MNLDKDLVGRVFVPLNIGFIFLMFFVTWIGSIGSSANMQMVFPLRDVFSLATSISYILMLVAFIIGLIKRKKKLHPLLSYSFWVIPWIVLIAHVALYFVELAYFPPGTRQF